MKLNPSNIPVECTHLLPFAEKWGIGDDYDRETAVETATEQELRNLIDSAQALPDETLYDWLAGKESSSKTPTEEYLAFTCMTMAYDSARTKLTKKRTTEQGGAGQRR